MADFFGVKDQNGNLINVLPSQQLAENFINQQLEENEKEGIEAMYEVVKQEVKPEFILNEEREYDDKGLINEGTIMKRKQDDKQGPTKFTEG